MRSDLHNFDIVRINKDKYRERQLRKINDIDPSFDDEVVSFSVMRTVCRCPRYIQMRVGKSWAITYLFLTVELPVGCFLRLVQILIRVHKSKDRFYGETLTGTEYFDATRKTNFFLKIKRIFSARIIRAQLWYRNQLSLTITNDLSLEMRVTVRLSRVSTNRLSYSIVYVVSLIYSNYQVLSAFICN